MLKFGVCLITIFTEIYNTRIPMNILYNSIDIYYMYVFCY